MTACPLRGQKRPRDAVRAASGRPSTADIGRCGWQLSSVPQPDIPRDEGPAAPRRRFRTIQTVPRTCRGVLRQAIVARTHPVRAADREMLMIPSAIRITFAGSLGHELAARLDLPGGAVRAY